MTVNLHLTYKFASRRRVLDIPDDHAVLAGNIAGSSWQRVPKSQQRLLPALLTLQTRESDGRIFNTHQTTLLIYLGAAQISSYAAPGDEWSPSLCGFLRRECDAGQISTATSLFYRNRGWPSLSSHRYA